MYVRPHWHLWALLRTVQDDGGDAARSEVRGLGKSPITISAAMLLYADAVAAGRAGDATGAACAFAAARSELDGPGFAARRHLAERLVAECAMADGWGDPAAWLTDASRYFHDAGYDRVERACRRLLRDAGAPVPRREHGHRSVPRRLATLGVTDREAEVLELVARGMTNSEVAGRLVISVRTVDKHVERLLAKTGARRRSELTGFGT